MKKLHIVGIIVIAVIIELSYFIAGGLISFSAAFFNGVLLGLDIQQAFEEARRGMAHYQTARIQDNGDGELAWQAQIGFHVDHDLRGLAQQ